MKSPFSSLDRWLIQNWERAGQMEMAMKAVREKYEQLFERVAERVKRELPRLDEREICVSGSEPSVIFYRQRWYRKAGWWPSGLYIDNVGLENVTVQSSDAPYAGVWLRPRDEPLLQGAKRKVQAAAKRALRGQKVSWVDDERFEHDCGWYELPEGRDELLRMLLHGDAEQFIDHMAKHVRRLAPLIPVLDRILSKSR